MSGADPYKIVLWGTDEEHQEYAEMLKQVDQNWDPQANSSMKIYDLDKIDTTMAVPIIQQAVPRATFGNSSSNRRIIIWATEAGHTEIQGIITKLEEQGPVSKNAQMKVLAFSNIPAGNAAQTLTMVYPQARYTLNGADAYKLAVWGTEEEIQQYSDILKQVDDNWNPQSNTSMKVYSFKATVASTVVPIIQADMPTVRFGPSPDPYKMVAWATDAQHEKIASIVQTLEAEQTAVNNGQMKVYQLEVVPVSTAQAIVGAAHPSVRFGPSPDNKKMIAWATEEQHAEIQELVNNLESSAADKGADLKIYTLEATGASYAYQIVANAVPGIVVTFSQDPSKMMVWGTPSQLAKVDKIVEEIKADGAPGKDSYVETYAFNKIPAANAIGILQMSFPQARITTTQDPRKLAIWAKPNEHQGLAAVVEKLESGLGENDERAIQVFPLNNVSHTTLLEFLKPELKANANFTPNTATDNLIVQAPQAQMEELAAAITELIEKLPKDEKPVSQVYRFQYSDPNAAAAVLRSLTPAANIAIDQRARSLVITASPADQETIAAAIKQMDAVDASERANVLKHYKVNNIEVSSMMGMLQTLFAFQSEVRFSMDGNTSTLVAYANEKQHEEIAQFIQELDSVGAAQTSKAYPLKNLDPSNVFAIVRSLFPRNPVVPDQATRSIVFVGSETDHQRVAEMIESIDEKQSQTAQKIVAYPIQNVEPNSLVNMLQNLYRFRSDIYFSIDQRNGIIMAHAPEEYQEKIAATIAELEQKKGTTLTKAFSSSKVSGRSLYQLLQTQFSRFPDVGISLDPQGGLVMISASEQKMAEIEKAVSAIESSAKDLVTEVYKLQDVDARTLYQVLQGMLPDVRSSFDNQSNTLMVAATVEEQELVQNIIKQLEEDEVSGTTSRVSKVYQSEKIDPNSLVRMIRELFQNSRSISVTENRDTNSVLVNAKPSEHARIEEAMQAIEEGTSLEETQVYKLAYADPDSVQDALKGIAPKARIGLDENNYSLIVTALEKDQARIKEAIEKLDIDPDEGKKLEIFTLQVNDPYTAESAVEKFFGNSFWDDDPTAPLIDTDTTNQQLLVQGTEKQISEIRQFLIKMGESHLAQETNSSNKKIRVIPFDGNTQEAVEEIKRIWPQLRKNRIDVVVPSAVAPTMRKYRQLHQDEPEEDEKPASGGVNFSVEDEVEPVQTEPDTANTTATVEEAATETEPTEENRQEKEEFQKLVEKARARLKEIQAEAEEQNEEAKGKEASAQDSPQSDQPKTVSPENKEAAPANSEIPANDNPVDPNAESSTPVTPPPVIIAPGEDSITISSDDPEALNQIENLLRAMS
ncbi:MAG: hypothetical protein KDA65_16600, partial [Planctomycetaceae bacterium]|nr:hypothetical protein [Planctomycetaceae bacterium]